MFSTFKFMGGAPLPPGTVPGAPVSVGVSRSSAGAVTITWGAPSSDGNRPITGYGAYITNQNGGFTAASTTTGPTARSVTFGTDNHGSYNGYVYTINAIGNSSVAGGGAACAYYGYNFTTGNCDGYTRYDINTDGGCGFYRVDTEYDSPSCGYVYNPCAGCPAYGTHLGYYYGTNCAGNGGCDYNFKRADGCCGEYVAECDPNGLCT
jgi:hypothetical protein